jgi:predicted DNA-binding ribbon-helix-helix protein
MGMRLSVTLEPEVYALAKSLARADDISLSAVINQKLRDSFFGAPDSSFVKNGLLVSRSKIVVTRAMVQQALEDDE